MKRPEKCFGKLQWLSFTKEDIPAKTKIIMVTKHAWSSSSTKSDEILGFVEDIYKDIVCGVRHNALKWEKIVQLKRPWVRLLRRRLTCWYFFHSVSGCGHFGNILLKMLILVFDLQIALFLKHTVQCGLKIGKKCNENECNRSSTTITSKAKITIFGKKILDLWDRMKMHVIVVACTITSKAKIKMLRQTVLMWCVSRNCTFFFGF